MLDEPRPISHAVIATLLLFGALAGATYYFAGETGLEKLGTSLALPVGVVWSILVLTSVAALLRRSAVTATLSVIGLVVLTAAGNQSVAGMLVRPLEEPFVGMTDDASVETAVLLGGGVWETPGGRPQGNAAGDRVMAAAALYHGGRVKRIHCTGTLTGDLSRLSRDEADISADLLRSLGVPDEAITLGVGGNTSEEIAAIKTAVDAGELTEPVGVVTSAWHMSRVVRLAKAAEITVVPLPGDFRSGGNAPAGAAVLAIVPTAGALELSTLAVREYLASLMGR